MNTNIIAEVQELLRNARYMGDGYVCVMTHDIEALQESLRECGERPNEPADCVWPRRKTDPDPDAIEAIHRIEDSCRECGRLHDGDCALEDTSGL